MKALVYLCPGFMTVEDRPKPGRKDAGDVVAPDLGHGAVRAAQTAMQVLALEAS